LKQIEQPTRSEFLSSQSSQAVSVTPIYGWFLLEETDL